MIPLHRILKEAEPVLSSLDFPKTSSTCKFEPTKCAQIHKHSFRDRLCPLREIDGQFRVGILSAGATFSPSSTPGVPTRSVPGPSCVPRRPLPESDTSGHQGCARKTEREVQARLSHPGPLESLLLRVHDQSLFSADLPFHCSLNERCLLAGLHMTLLL